MAKPGIGLGVLTPECCLPCLDSFPGIGMNGQSTAGSSEILVLSAAVCHQPAWPAVGMGDVSAGCVSQAGTGSSLRAPGAVGSLVLSCPAVSTTFLLPWYLSTLSQGLQCPLLTIKAELGSPQCCLRLTPVGTLLGAFGR